MANRPRWPTRYTDEARSGNLRTARCSCRSRRSWVRSAKQGSSLRFPASSSGRPTSGQKAPFPKGASPEKAQKENSVRKP